MSSKLSTYPVVERRLRPIYESLDTGNNKKALQEAEKVLRRQPGLQCAKVLKCLALLRMGKEADCVELLEAVRKEEPIDDATLQAMTVCYRDIHKPQVICDMYRLACEKDPGNEELLTYLFYSYVRISDYNKQQQTAMALHKLRPKNQYYFWAIMSNLLQTRDSAQEIMEYCLPPLFRDEGVSTKTKQLNNSQNVCLKLSAKMIDRYLDKISSEQEVLLWFVIQEMQGKLDEALKALQGIFGGMQPQIFVVRIADQLRLENWEDACHLLKSLTQEHRDNWKYMQCYIDTVFRLAESTKDGLHLSEACCYLNFSVVMNHCMVRCNERVPVLGWLEFYRQLKQRNLPTCELGDVVGMLMEYMFKFGTADCCLHILKPYLSCLTPDETKDFLNQVWSYVSLGIDQLPKQKESMHLHISNLELVRCLRDPSKISLEENKTLVLVCLKYFVYSQSFSIGLPITEPRSSDRYALLAAHVLYESWVETDNYKYLFDGIVICHFALKCSPSNSQFKLLLLKFYHILGGCQGAHDAYISLDIKHMQLDTLGYLHVFPLIRNAHYTLASSMLNTTLKFFTNNYKDDHILYAYKYDAYTKIPEFIVIRERFNNSIHYSVSTVEKMLMDIFHSSTHSITTQVVNEMEVFPHHDNIQWSKLQDNRDFKVIWELDREENCLNKQVIEQTFNHDIVLLKLRSILLRLVVGVVQISGENLIDVEKLTKNESDGCNNNYETSFEFTKATLITLTKNLEEQIKALNDNMPNPAPKKIIAAPPDSRLLILLVTNYFDLILGEMKLMIDLISGESSSQSDSQLHLSEILLCFEDILSLISNDNIQGDNLKRINLLIQTCALYIELVSFTCIVVASCDIFLKHNKQSLAKKNKKKKECNIEKDCTSTEWKFDILEKLSDCIIESINIVMNIMKSLERKLREKNIKLGSLIISSKIEGKDEKEKLFSISGQVNETLSASFNSSVGHILKLLKQKLKYLSSLKQ